MRRPCADREEKRVTRGSDRIRTRAEQEQFNLNDPNQRLEMAEGESIRTFETLARLSCGRGTAGLSGATIVGAPVAGVLLEAGGVARC